MMDSQIIMQLRALKLPAMADCYRTQSDNPAAYQLAFDDRLKQIVDAESSRRAASRLKRLLTAAKLPYVASLEEVDQDYSRQLDRRVYTELATCEFVAKRHNVIFTGPSGVGKTHLAIALMVEACRHGLFALFVRFDELEDQIQQAADSGSLPELKKRLLAPDLLMIDDFALVDMGRRAVEVLLHVVDKRLRRGSLMITSQFKTGLWQDRLADPTLANAVLDRIVHGAVRIDLSGDSYRATAVRAKPRRKSA